MKHWSVVGNDIRNGQYIENMNLIARVAIQPDNSHIGNAYLIAAAPELLAICETLVTDVHSNHSGWSIGPMDASKGGKLDMLCSAIKKAKGGY